MSDESNLVAMVLIRGPRPFDQFTPWPWGPDLSPWTYNPITISQALHQDNWRHVLESKHLFRCFYTMCADFFNSRDLPSELEVFVESERKAYRKAFEAAQKKVNYTFISFFLPATLSLLLFITILSIYMRHKRRDKAHH